MARGASAARLTLVIGRAALPIGLYGGRNANPVAAIVASIMKPNRSRAKNATPLE